MWNSLQHCSDGESRRQCGGQIFERVNHQVNPAQHRRTRSGLHPAFILHTIMQSLIREAFFNIFKGTEEQRAVASEAAGKKLNCVLLKVFQCLPEIKKKKKYQGNVDNLMLYSLTDLQLITT